MKITALLVMKVSPAPASSTVLLANASDVSQFGFFQRPSAKEFIVFASRTIAGRTPLGQRQSVEQDGMLFYPAWILGIFLGNITLLFRSMLSTLGCASGL